MTHSGEGRHSCVSYDGDMSGPRHTEVRRHKRWAKSKLRRRGDTRPACRPEPPARQYPVQVTHARDTSSQEPTEAQQALSAWFRGVVERREATGQSRASIARAAGLSRKDLYRWLEPATIPKHPKAATVRRICEGLGEPYAVPARILGFTDDEVPAERDNASALEAKVKRARAMARSPHLNDDERAQYAALLRGYERAYERMLDDLIERYEGDERRRA